MSKSIKSLAMVLCLTFATTAKAVEATPAVEPAEGTMRQMPAADQEVMHGLLCTAPGAVAPALPASSPSFDPAEAAADPQIKEMRAQLVSFLADPAAAAQRILNEGSRDGVGPFGLLVACALVVGMEDVLTAKGCSDDAGKVLNGKPAADFCKDLFAKAAAAKAPAASEPATN